MQSVVLNMGTQHHQDEEHVNKDTDPSSYQLVTRITMSEEENVPRTKATICPSYGSSNINVRWAWCKNRPSKWSCRDIYNG